MYIIKYIENGEVKEFKFGEEPENNIHAWLIIDALSRICPADHWGVLNTDKNTMVWKPGLKSTQEKFNKIMESIT